MVFVMPGRGQGIEDTEIKLQSIFLSYDKKKGGGGLSLNMHIKL